MRGRLKVQSLFGKDVSAFSIPGKRRDGVSDGQISGFVHDSTVLMPQKMREAMRQQSQCIGRKWLSVKTRFPAHGVRGKSQPAQGLAATGRESQNIGGSGSPEILLIKKRNFSVIHYCNFQFAWA